MRCAGYIRVSTTKEGQKSSIINQKNIFIQYIQQNNWTLHDFYIDIDTGTTGKRENLQRLIQDAEQKKFDVIVAKELSRLARNGSLSYQIRDIAQKNHIGIITLDGAVNSLNGDVSKYGLYTWLYEEESQRMSERIKSSLNVRAAKGLFKGSIPPYGYYVEDGKLFIRNDGTPNTVRWIFEQYISGRGFDAIARSLYVNDVPSPSMIANRKNPSPKWHGTSVRHILENPHYTGHLIQQRETTMSVTSKVRQKNPKNKIVTVKHTHKPIISEETFELTQSLIANRAQKRYPTSKHLFSGLMTCNDCGASMHYKFNRKGYLCGSYVKMTKKACTHHAVKELVLIQHVLKDIEKFSNLILNRDTYNKLIEINKKEQKRISKKLNVLESKFKATQDKKAKLLNLLLDETIKKADYHFAVDNLNKGAHRILSEKDQLLNLLELRNDVKDIDFLKKILSEVSVSSDITNSVLNNLIKHIKIKKNGTPIVEYRFKILNHLDDLFN